MNEEISRLRSKISFSERVERHERVELCLFFIPYSTRSFRSTRLFSIFKSFVQTANNLTQHQDEESRIWRNGRSRHTIISFSW